MHLSNPVKFGFAMAALIGVSGCASIDSADYRQTVLVTSTPPGAVIRDNTGRELGETPAYVRVRRGSAPQISVGAPGQEPQPLKLKTRYRWGGSFASNLILVTYAPLGWLTDWLTGTAWGIDNPADVVIAGFAGVQRLSTIAIAPPVVSDRELSDAIGLVLESKLRTNKYRLMRYDDTAPLFSYYASDQGLSQRRYQRDNLFFELKADRVLTSEVSSSDEGYVVKAELKNVYTGQTEANYLWEVVPAEAALKAEVSARKGRLSYFHLLPNTLFLNFSTFNSSLTIDEKQYIGKSVGSSSFSDTIYDYLGAISFSHLELPRPHMRRHWRYDFIPAMMLSHRTIRYEQYSALEDVTFERWYVSGGYGLEIGHQSSAGLFYFDLVPMATWTQLTVRGSSFSETRDRTLFTLLTELGYTYFFNNHLVGKVYVRGLGEDTSIWQSAVRDATGKDAKLSQANSSFAGLAIGYYFPSSLSAKKESWRTKNLPQATK